MWRYNLKVTLRHLLRNKSYLGIQLMTLVVGISCLLLALLYVKHELGYEKHLKGYQDIYRITTKVKSETKELHSAMAAPNLADALRTEFDVNLARVFYWPYSEMLVEYDGEKFYEDKYFRVDSSFLSTVPLELTLGKAETALSNPNILVISENIRQKYFGQENPVGKTLKINGVANYTVAGVFKDLPNNTHFDFEILAYNGRGYPGGWDDPRVWLYLSLPDYDREYINSQLSNVVNKYFPESLKSRISLELQAIKDIHLTTGLEGEFKASGNLEKLILFVVAGIMITVLTSLNYVNLSTAKFLGRAKEIGIKKVHGALKSQLVSQFLLESVLISATSALLSLLSINLLDPYLPYYLQISNHGLAEVVQYTLAGALLIGLLAGIYPAIFLSNQNAIKSLKQTNSSPKNDSARKLLVTIQLVISFVFLFMIVKINEQLNFVINKENQIPTAQTIILNVPGTVARSWDWDLAPFKSEVLKIPGVSQVSAITTPWKQGGLESRKIRFTQENQLTEVDVDLIWISDMDYDKIYGLEFLQGRKEITQFETDSTNDLQFQYVINQKTAEVLGGDTPINQKFELSLGPNTWSKGEVKGVVKDFHYQSMHNAIRPMVFIYGAGFSDVAIRMTGQTDNVIRSIESTWSEFSNWPMKYTYLDTAYNELYKTENESRQLLLWLSIIASCLAVFGLIGLVVYSVSLKKKNIAVHKVLGAGTFHLMIYLNRSYLALLLLSLGTAIPFAYFLFQSWIQSFAYQTDFSISYLIILGLLVIVALLVITSLNTLKAAHENPIKNLRSE